MNKLGYEYYKVLINLHNRLKEKERELKMFVKQHPNIIYDNEVLGGDDYEIEIQVKSPAELRAILDEIKKRFSTMIKDHEILHYYKEHKLQFLPGTV